MANDNSLEIRYGVKTWLLALFVMLIGGLLLWGADGLSATRECKGRNAFFCDLLQSMPEGGRQVFWVVIGLLAIAGGAIIIRRMSKSRIALTCDANGISHFPEGQAHLVPWAAIKSLSIANSALTIKLHAPMDVKGLFGTRSRKQVAVSVAGCRAFVGGEKVRGSAKKVLKNWLARGAGTQAGVQA